MNVKSFLIYTAAGGAIWMTILVCLGYFIGENEDLATKYLPMIKLVILGTVGLAGLIYVRRHMRKSKEEMALVAKLAEEQSKKNN